MKNLFRISEGLCRIFQFLHLSILKLLLWLFLWLNLFFSYLSMLMMLCILRGVLGFLCMLFRGGGLWWALVVGDRLHLIEIVGRLCFGRWNVGLLGDLLLLGGLLGQGDHRLRNKTIILLMLNCINSDVERLSSS